MERNEERSRNDEDVLSPLPNSNHNSGDVEFATWVDRVKKEGTWILRQDLESRLGSESFRDITGIVVAPEDLDEMVKNYMASLR